MFLQMQRDYYQKNKEVIEINIITYPLKKKIKEVNMQKIGIIIFLKIKRMKKEHMEKIDIIICQNKKSKS